MTNIRPEYIDIHAHVNFAVYDEDRGEVVRRAREAGAWMINVGTHFETSKQVVDLAEQSGEGVYAIIGLHPIHTSPLSLVHADPQESREQMSVYKTGEIFNKEAYRVLLAHPKVVGIGECGLDFFRRPEHASLDAGAKNRQEIAFRSQIELAIECDKPIMIHARDSYAEILEIIDEYLSTNGPQLKGNAHFFAGSIDQARAFLDRGFTLSVTGVVTFAKQYRELVEFVPLDSLMVETDCPYVAPVPFRGKRNEPLYVREIAAKVADIKGIDVEIAKKAFVDNAFRLFRLT